MLDELRREITEITKEMIRLAGRRKAVAREVGRVKGLRSLPTEDRKVEAALEREVKAECDRVGLDRKSGAKILRVLLDESKQVQETGRKAGTMGKGASRRRVAVLGSAGGMGGYFARRLLADGHVVTGYDIRKADEPPEGLIASRSNAEAVRQADAVLVAVPTGSIAGVAKDIAPMLKKGAFVVEMSSIKSGTVRELKRAFRGRQVSLLSVHPMFGPASVSDHPRILVLGSSRELDAARSLFPWAALAPVGGRDHDRLMAYALNLVHITNLAFASTLAKGMGITEFEELAGPFGRSQLVLAEAILSEDPSLFAMIQFENPYSSEVIRSFIEESRRLLHAVEAKDQTRFLRQFDNLAKAVPGDRLSEALARVYSSFD